MEVKKKAKDAMLVAIEQEREGDQIDRSLLKNVLGIFIEVGMGGMDCYNEDFEQHLLSTTAEYYKKKAASWIAVSRAAMKASLIFFHVCFPTCAWVAEAKAPGSLRRQLVATGMSPSSGRQCTGSLDRSRHSHAVPSMIGQYIRAY